MLGQFICKQKKTKKKIIRVNRHEFQKICNFSLKVMKSNYDLIKKHNHDMIFHGSKIKKFFLVLFQAVLSCSQFILVKYDSFHQQRTNFYHKNYLDSYLKKKPADCIIYSEDGRFSILDTQGTLWLNCIHAANIDKCKWTMLFYD